MKRPTRHDVGNMDWKARTLGAQMEREPEYADLVALIQRETYLIFARKQIMGFVASARYAYQQTHLTMCGTLPDSVLLYQYKERR